MTMPKAKKTRFDFCQPVYLVCDPECMWLITGMLVEIDGPVKWQISNGYQKRIVFEQELTDEQIFPVKIKGLK